MVHLITYDLKSPHDTSDDYKRVIDGIKSIYGSWCHLEKSVWLVATGQTAPEVRDSVKKFLCPSDILFTARLSGNWAGLNLGSERVDWLNKQAF